MDVTRDINVDLTCGYLLRPITPDLGIKGAPFTSSASADESRLKGCLKEMNEYNGETLHGLRSGCATTLALTGADLAEIMTRRHTALYYKQLVKVLNPAEVSARLASNIGTEPSRSWQDINQLKWFVCAFPTITSTAGRDITTHLTYPKVEMEMLITIKAKTKYSLRNSQNLEVPRPRSEIGRSSFKHRAALAWNLLPHHVKEYVNLRSFKTGLNANKHLLNSINFARGFSMKNDDFLYF